MSAHQDDPALALLRTEIEAADREILEAFLRRVGVARAVRRHKDERGYTFVDAGREEELLRLWLAAADGSAA